MVVKKTASNFPANMKTGVAVIFMVLLLGAFAGSLFTLPLSPQYGGKTLSECLEMLNCSCFSGNPADTDKAAAAIRQMGASALPQLHQILRSRPNSPANLLRKYAIQWHLVPASKLPLWLQITRAAEALSLLAENADVDIAGLVPELRIQFTNSGCGDSSILWALARAGPEGVSYLTNLLATGGFQARFTGRHFGS